MKIERKDIGVKEVPEDMKKAAIARKKAFAKKNAPKAKKVVAQPQKPPTKTAKVVAAVKKVLNKKGNKRGKKNRSKNL